MPAFLVAMMPFLAALLGAVAFRIAAGLGFGLATYSGMGALVDSILAQIGTLYSGMGADMAAMVYILQIDRCINLLFSAYVARLTIKGMTALGSVVTTRWSAPS